MPLVHVDRFDDGGRELDAAGALRTFGMIDGDWAVALAIQPGAAWRAVSQNGWQIIEMIGPRGNLVTLER